MWWISLVAFQTRKRPPAIRIRSRQEKACPKAVKTGCRHPDDPGDGARAGSSRMISAAADAEPARPHPVLGRQLVGQDRDEDQVVDAEHHLHGDQRDHRRPAFRRGQEGEVRAEDVEHLGHSLRSGAAHVCPSPTDVSRRHYAGSGSADNPSRPRQRLRRSKGDMGSCARSRSLKARRALPIGGNLPISRRLEALFARSLPVHAAARRREGFGHAASGRRGRAASRRACRWSRPPGGSRSSTSVSPSRSRTSSAPAPSTRSPPPTAESRR